MYAQNGMKAANYLLMRRMPAFQHMMKRAKVSPTTSPLLVERLTGSGSTLRESTPGTNALHSCHAASPLPDGPFTPVILNDQLRYLLAGCGCLTDSHPLGRF